jgi:dCTP deaminase
MILPAQTIRHSCIISPFYERTVVNGMSFGLSHAGYDVRIAENMVIYKGQFKLSSTIEHFDLPNSVMAMVHDKSSWARRGLSLFNTVIEPGWRGHLTLELTLTGTEYLIINKGDPIAQIVFMRLEEPTENPYSGKYQDQKAGPQPALKEGE